MQKFSRDSFNVNEAINELMHESGVIIIKNAYNLNDIKEAREIVNHFADTEEQKETHFNAEAEASKQIKLKIMSSEINLLKISPLPNKFHILC